MAKKTKKNNDMAESVEVSKTAAIVMTIVFIILAVILSSSSFVLLGVTSIILPDK